MKAQFLALGLLVALAPVAPLKGRPTSEATLKGRPTSTQEGRTVTVTLVRWPFT